MAIAPRNDSAIRAVIFDLDEALLVRAPAWIYAIEEGVLSSTGSRVDARPLAGEYRSRPFEHALGVLISRDFTAECAELCAEIYNRSAMKKVLVHEGLGMALDVLRGLRIEAGAISREPHALARKQIESTGLDRFIAALSCTPAGEGWNPGARVSDCVRFFEQPVGRCLFVSHDGHDLRRVAPLGLTVREAGWAAVAPSGFMAIGTPADLERTIWQASAR